LKQLADQSISPPLGSL